MKKKLLVCTMILSMTFSMLAGCGNNEDALSQQDSNAITEEMSDEEVTSNESEDTSSESDETEDVQTNAQTEQNDSKEPTNNSYSEGYEAVYAKLLDTIYYSIGHPQMWCMLFPGDLGVMENSYYEENAFDYVGYRIADLSGDGIPELMVGGIERSDAEEWEQQYQGTIYAVYSCENDKPKCVINGWSRNNYWFIEENRFFNEGSGGAMYTSLGACKLAGDGSDIQWEDFYFTDEIVENEIGFFYNTTGVYDKNKAVQMDITADEFWAIEEDYLARRATPELTPFSQYHFNESEITDANLFAGYYNGEFDEKDYYDTFYADDSENRVSVLLSTDGILGDFKVLSLMVTDFSEDGKLICDTEELYDKGTLTSFCPLVLEMTFWGDTPSYGISYTDGEGNERRFAIGMSGMDGSVILEEF